MGLGLLPETRFVSVAELGGLLVWEGLVVSKAALGWVVAAGAPTDSLLHW